MQSARIVRDVWGIDATPYRPQMGARRISEAVRAEVRRLRGETTVSMRDIAKRVGISDGSADAICAGMPRRAVPRQKAKPELVETWARERAGGATYAAIAKKYGVKCKTVSRWVRDGRFASRGWRVADEVRAAYVAGVTALELVERFGLAHQSIAKIVGAENYRSQRCMLSPAEVEAIRQAACTDERLAGLVGRLAKGA